MNVFDLLEARVRATPRRAYLHTSAGTRSFGDVHRDALACAAAYEGAGVGSGEPVALVGSRSPEVVAAVFGLLRLGAVVIPLDVDEPRDRIAALLARIAPRFAICDDPVLAGSARVLPLAPAGGAAPAAAAPPLRGDETAFTFFTTGSTGRPKGIELSHRAVISGQEWLQRAFDLGPDDRQLFRTTLGVTNLLREVLWPVVAGCGACLLPPGRHADVSAHVEAVDRFGVTVVGMVPLLVDAMVSCRAGERSLASLRHVIATSDQFLAEQHDRFRAALPAARLHNVYGLTEAPYIALHTCAPGAAYAGAVPVGRGADLAPLVLDEDLREAAPGAPGRLYVHGAGMMSRYWRDPDLTASRFTTSGDLRLFDTGDTAFRDEAGEIHLTGRSEFLVKIGGQRADVLDIERLVRRIEGVGEASVLPYEIGNGVKRLSAWIVPSPGALLGEGEVRRRLAGELPPFMVPTTIRFVSGLPRTHNGKVDRAGLVATLAPSAAAADPLAPALDRLTAIAASVLNVSRLSPDRTIVEQGGDSISAFLIGVRAHEIGLSVNPSDLIALPLGRVLAAARPAGRDRRADGPARDELHTLPDYGWQPRDIERLMTNLRETRP